MEASSLPSSLQSAPPVANATAASTAGADTASPSREPFAQVMQQALATAQSHFARQSNAPTDNHAAATKAPLSSSPEKEQHRSQDSQTDPASHQSNIHGGAEHSIAAADVDAEPWIER